MSNNYSNEKTVAQRRAEVVARYRATKPHDSVRGQALVGLTMMVSSVFTFSSAETYGGEWWLLTGILLGGGGSLFVNAVHRAN